MKKLINREPVNHHPKTDNRKLITGKQVKVSAPGKLMLLGEHAVVYGHPCIVTAVDQRFYLTAELIDEPFFILDAPQVKIKNYKKPISQLGRGTLPQAVQFVEAGTRSVLDQGPTFTYGIKITTRSHFSPQFGFGSSSASTVCTIFALSKLLNVKLSQKQLFDLSYKTVLEIQGKASGFDIAAAIYGGTLYFVTAGKKIQQIYSSSERSESRSKNKRFSTSSNNNGLPLTVAYAGIKADTTTMIAKVATLSQKHPQIVKKTYDLIENVVENGKKAIKNSDFNTLGELFNINQGYLESLGVSTPKLSALTYAARVAGAYGAKLSGAGGGDCIIALAPNVKRNAVETAITRAGGKIIKVQTNAVGVKLEP